MKQDILSAAQLEIFAEIALFLFLAAFAVIVIRAWKMPKETIQELESMPLQHDTRTTHKEEFHG